MPTVSPQDAAGAVLQAARVVFASRGYASTTVKSVAAAAGVAPGVVTSLYRNKERLFAAAMRLPFDPAQAVPELIAPGLDGMGERIARMVVTLMGDPQVRRDVSRLVTSAPAAGATAAAVRPGEAGSATEQVRVISEYLQAVIVDPVARAVGIPDARLRGSVVTAYLLGIVTTRYLLRVEPLASASDDEVVAVVGPAIQALLDPTRPAGGS
ncbi:MAG: TetR family transcriptional regulator [Candidatus Nanopelagicales bacterium]|jgi:AcrR family transcriptional regulator